jgi:hypothetical protein
MKNLTLLLIAITLIPAFSSAQKGLKPLFNGKDLDGWETYVGPKEKGGAPIGLNSDPLQIFTVTDLNGDKVLRISGEVNASLATKKEYENYHVRMIFKWGEKVYTNLNSGLLYHSFGPFGAGLNVWMSSHEFQLMTGKMGDSYCMGKSYFEITTESSSDGKNFTYSPKGEKKEFGDGKIAKNVSKCADFEKPKGEWNTIDLYCFGRTSVHVVNGNVAMVNLNSAKIENGTVTPLSKGKIQIQSEGGELFIKEIKIEAISKIPENLIQ